MSERPLVARYALGQPDHGSSGLGRAMARAHMSAFADQFSLAPQTELIVLLDYSGLEATNASYTERTLFWALDAGRAFAGEDSRTLLYANDGEDQVLPLPVFPIAIGVNEDIIDEIQAVASRTSRGVLVATDASKPFHVKLIGDIDRALKETLPKLSSTDGLSAADLHEMTAGRSGSGKSVGVNVFHNRLAALYRLRLAWRYKVDRFWKYSAIAKEISHG